MSGHKCRPACTAGWSPGRKSHCGVCGENFTTVANFDKHRVGGECVHPEKAGLALNGRGAWMKPGEVDFDERFKRAAS